MNEQNLTKSNITLTVKEMTNQYKQNGLFDAIKNEILQKDISFLIENQKEPVSISRYIERQVTEIVSDAVEKDNSLISSEKRLKQDTILKLESKLSQLNGEKIKNLVQKIIVENTLLHDQIHDELLDLYKSSLNI